MTRPAARGRPSMSTERIARIVDSRARRAPSHEGLAAADPSRPTGIVRLGKPVARLLQRHLPRDSVASMRAAIAAF